MRIFFLILTSIVSSSAYSYQLYRSGNVHDVRPSIRPYYCLAGGGNDDHWQGGWRELLKSINGGDVVIIREDKRRGLYESWLQSNAESGAFPHFNSVTTVSLDGQMDAFDQKVLEAVSKSELIFFAGGYQNNYFDIISSTPLQRLIQDKINQKNAAFAGTSAGMAILGDVAYGAHYPSPAVSHGFLSSLDVLLNPLGKAVDLVDGLLLIPHLNNIILDTHFAQRNRKGRLMGFLANAYFKNDRAYDGIGIDEETAFCFDTTGKGRVWGQNQVYFVRALRSPTINVDQSLSWELLYAKVLSDGDEFDLKDWGKFHALEVWSSGDFLIRWP